MIVPRLIRFFVDEARRRPVEDISRVVYVTDLVRCSQQAHFDRLYPDIAVYRYANHKIVEGLLIHRGLSSIFGDSSEVEREVEVDGVKIRGRADLLLDDTIYEFKFSNIRNGPHGHHILQLRIYLWLFNVKKGYLVYFTSDGIYEYMVEDPISEDEVKELLRELQENKIHPRHEWECRYCIYTTLCPFKRKEHV